jgi:hypothetical protein
MTREEREEMRIRMDKKERDRIRELYRIQELRFRKHRVTLSNQDIVEMAYLTKETIEPLIRDNEKLSMDQAHCYVGCFNLCQKLLKMADDEYLKRHRLREFYEEGRSLSWEGDRLSWFSLNNL